MSQENSFPREHRLSFKVSPKTVDHYNQANRDLLKGASLPIQILDPVFQGHMLLIQAGLDAGGYQFYQHGSGHGAYTIELNQPEDLEKLAAVKLELAKLGIIIDENPGCLGSILQLFNRR